MLFKCYLKSPIGWLVDYIRVWRLPPINICNFICESLVLHIFSEWSLKTLTNKTKEIESDLVRLIFAKILHAFKTFMWDSVMKLCLSVCLSYFDANIRGEMKRSLSVCLSYLDPNIRGEMKFSCLSVLLRTKYEEVYKWNVVCPSYLDPNIRGEMKRSLSCPSLFKKRTISNSVLWKKPLYQGNCQTGKVKIQKDYQNVW